jgi:hypothetical protein
MMTLDSAQRERAVHGLLGAFQKQRYAPLNPTNQEALWELLCAAHIAGQHFFGLHIQTHCAMLSLAWQHRDWREGIGQLVRVALVPIGHVFQRLPLGNSGRSNISAFKPMDVPPHLAHLIEQAATMRA